MSVTSLTTRAGDLKGMGRAALAELFDRFNEPAYRVEQLMKWMYHHDVSSFEEMTNLPIGLRQKLADHYFVGQLSEEAVEVSKDGTRKLLLSLHDGPTVEAVLIPEDNRRTACVSSQAGCGIGCAFCATALAGLTRNLTAGEIVEQVLALERSGGEKISNIVFMGMGEPFSNYGAVIQAARLLSDPWAFGIGARHITISTSGVVPAIERFIQEESQFVLAVSLHAATDDVRDTLVPINKKYPIKELIKVCREYTDATKRRITFEYVMIDGVTDTLRQARELIKIVRGLRCHINLIPLNPVPETGLERSQPERIVAFAREVAGAGIPTTIRRERGVDIQAACGQLRRSKGR